MVTWRQLIEREMTSRGETWRDVVACTLSDSRLHREFNDDFGAVEGKPFTLWTRERVYFPAKYDGAEWVASVARDPNGKPTKHIGGG